MSASDSEVVTRFAANPTRHLDVGEARIALLNRLYAQPSNGRFLLRVDNVGRAGVSEPFWLGVRFDLDKLSDAEPWWRVVRGPCKPVIEDSAAATKASGALPPGDWDETTWQSWKRMAGVATKLGSVALDRQLRLALTGVEDGPEMSILMPMIGRARVEARLAGKIA